MIKDRIQARIDALGISQFEAAERAGKGRHFIYDILNGRKQKVHATSLAALAQALECSIDYLLEKSEEVGAPPARDESAPNTGSSIAFAGIIENGALRRLSVSPPNHPPLMADTRYPVDQQLAFIYRGEDFEGVADGMYVIALAPEWYRSRHGGLPPDAPVVIERVRTIDGDLRIERVLRRLSGSAADQRLVERIGRSGKDEADTIAGVVVAAYRLM